MSRCLSMERWEMSDLFNSDEVPLLGTLPSFCHYTFNSCVHSVDIISAEMASYRFLAPTVQSVPSPPAEHIWCKSGNILFGQNLAPGSSDNNQKVSNPLSGLETHLGNCALFFFFACACCRVHVCTCAQATNNQGRRTLSAPLILNLQQSGKYTPVPKGSCRSTPELILWGHSCGTWSFHSFFYFFFLNDCNE